MTSSGDQVRVAIAGRGALARRAEVVLRQRLGPRVAFVPRFDEAHAVLLAGSADAAAGGLSGVTAGDPALYLDFTSHSRGRGVDAVRAVLHGEYVPPGRGIVSLPGCYASSVFSPLLHLETGDHLRVRRLTAFSVGGRSTLGVSATAALQPGRCRLASAGSTRMHVDEVARAIGGRLDLAVQLHNLDFPLSVAAMYLTRALGRAAPG